MVCYCQIWALAIRMAVRRAISSCCGWLTRTYGIMGLHPRHQIARTAYCLTMCWCLDCSNLCLKHALALDTGHVLLCYFCTCPAVLLLHMPCCVTFAHALLKQILQVVTHCLLLSGVSRLHRSHCLAEALFHDMRGKKSASEVTVCNKRNLSSTHDVRTKLDVQ